MRVAIVLQSENMKFSDLESGIIQSGPLKGRKFYKTKGLQTEKTNKLSFETPTVREDGFSQ